MYSLICTELPLITHRGEPNLCALLKGAGIRHASVVTEDKCTVARCKITNCMKDRNNCSFLMQWLQLKILLHKKWIQPWVMIFMWSQIKRLFLLLCLSFFLDEFSQLYFLVITINGKKQAADFKCTISDPSIFHMFEHWLAKNPLYNKSFI